MKAVKYLNYLFIADKDRVNRVLVADQETLDVTDFLFPTGVKLMKETPVGLVVQCEDGVNIVNGGQNTVASLYVNLLCKGRFEDTELVFDKGYITGVADKKFYFGLSTK